ncbi:MAG TPA: hypothetical protein VF173_06095 [Thermoanaerobaculia bacterium]|nr:hypothetical protein [Thermoanaerobaculia bacterium]
MSAERLYHRLPEIVRRRDLDQGEPLRALLAVVESELAAIEDDVSRLYDNQFVETAEDWVVPYLADLLGAGPLGALPNAGVPPRTQAASAVDYRRHKGTVAVLERLARDVTGWYARGVEYFQYLAHTQNPAHVRSGKGGLFDLRRPLDLTLMGGPFEPADHFRTVDVRRIATRRGRFNLPNLGLFVWRLATFALDRVPARSVSGVPAGRYNFDALGFDTRLFNRPAARAADVVRQDTEAELPVALRPAALTAGLASYYGAGKALLAEADGVAVPVGNVVIADLSAWAAPAAGKVAIDPLLGRLMFGTAPTNPASVRVSYAYGFAAGLGGGPYDRRATLADPTAFPLVIDVGKTLTGPPIPPAQFTFSTIQQALTQWAGSTDALIRIQDSEVYDGSLAITLPPGRRLVLEAANGARPNLNLMGVLRIVGSDPASSVTLSGLRIAGPVEVEGSFELRIEHSTLIPGTGDSLRAGAGGVAELQVTAHASILGAVRLPAGIAGLTVRDGIIDGGPRAAIVSADAAGSPPGPPVTLERVTVFGAVSADTLRLASEVLFTGTVTVQRRQEGCLRFSYVPPGSAVPRAYRCQPQLALTRQAEAVGLDVLPDPSNDRTRTLDALVPRFTATAYGDPAYGQLALTADPGLEGGAADGGEMGAFHLLEQPQREAQLRALIDEYGRFGLDVGIFFVD